VTTNRTATVRERSPSTAAAYDLFGSDAHMMIVEASPHTKDV
jgi:hypothetical protein